MAGTPSVPELQQKILRKIRMLRELPTNLEVAIRLFRLPRGGGGDDAEPAEYARVIASDPGLAARILNVANSPWFGLAIRITQPLFAVNMLGIPAVRTLAINFCLSGLHHELRLGKEEGRRFWEAALCKAVAARIVATHLRPTLADDAYVAGIFQDIALPVMYVAAPGPVSKLLTARLNTERRLEAERKELGVDHAALGAVLAERLQLPELHVRLIGPHHDHAALLRATGADAPVLAHAAYAASLFPHRMDYWDARDIEALREFLALHTGGQGVPALQLEAFLDQVSTECREQFSYFDQSHVTEMGLLELVAQATREMAEDAVRLVNTVREMETHVASADQTMARMELEHSRLADEASHDPLTGALNRSGFQRQCAQTLAAAQREGHPVALLFMDIDGFKQINDVHGHAAGDAALKGLVVILRQCTRTSDVIGRLGGDEFAIFLPNCPREKAIDIAQRIGAVAAEPKTAGEFPIRVSVGITHAAGDKIRSLDSLITASDRRMYIAKHAGGNTISVEAGGTADAVK